MSLSKDTLPQPREWLSTLTRPVHPEKLTAEESFAYTQFLHRVRNFVIVKALANALLVLLFMLTVMPDAPGTVLATVVDGLLLLPYWFLVRRWPALSTIVLLSLAAASISAADIASTYQTFTSGVFYAALIIAGAVLLLYPRNIAIATAAITSIFVLTYLLEMTGVIRVTMTLITPRAILRVMALHIVSFLGIGAISGALSHLYRQLLASRSQQDLQQALQEGFRDISANPDLDMLLQRIAERAVSSIPAVDRALLLVREGDSLVVRAAAGYTPMNPIPRAIPLELVGWISQDKPSLTTNLPEQVRQFMPPEFTARLQTIPPSRATYVLPLQTQGDLRVLLVATNIRRPDAFDDEAKKLVDLFARQSGVAIENTQLLASSQARLQAEIVLGRIGQEIASLLRIPDLVPAIYQHIKQVMDASSFLIAVKHTQDGALELLSPIDVGQVYPDRTIPPQGVLGWVIKTKRPIRFNDYQREVVAYPEIRVQPLHKTTFIPGSLLAVPLVVGKQVIGALSVQSPQVNAYDEQDERFLAALADYIAVAVKNARLYDEVQQKQAELQGLISAVSERFQGPVEALIGFARLLRESREQGPTAEKSEYLERLERNSRWVAQLTQDMLFLSRLDQVREEREPIALSTLVRGVVTHLELEHQGIKIVVQEDMPTLYADPVLMWAFFRNLLQNACRLLPGSSTPQIDVGCTLRAESPCLHVRGNGQTLSPEQLAHAFDLFFPIGGPEGAGIGLAIAQRIAQRYGCHMWAEAEAGQGTTFCLPLSQELLQPNQAARSTDEQTTTDIGR
jgi:K+-sensing histidine kinase KdpD